MSPRHTSRVNLPMIARVIGWLLIIEAAFMLVPMITCIIYGETDTAAFAISTAVTAACGALMTWGIHPKRTEMGKHEGLLLTALVWVIFSIFGMLPFLKCDTPLDITEAFFESMSGFTTTGSSIIQTIEVQSHGILMWRALMQWIGGMGIILFTLAVVPMLNSSGGMQMFNAEVTGITREKLRPRISQTAKNLWILYFALTIALILLLWAGPMNLFESLCHALGTISTGGFSTNYNSISAYNSIYIDSVLTLFMFLGGVNFALLFTGITSGPVHLWRNEVFRVYIGAITLMMVAFAAMIVCTGHYTGIASVTIAPLFQIVSTISSTGYVDSNLESWGPLALSLTMVMMFFGACAGSTSGGAKLDRMIYLYKNLRNEIRRTVNPRAVLSVRLNGQPVAPDTVAKVMAFLAIYVALIMLGGIALTALGLPLVDSFFSSFSAISNTGLSAGVTGYGGSFGAIPAAGIWVLSMLMLIGRLEIFTIIVLLSPIFWRK